MRNKEATRESILEAGKKAFMEKGYSGAYLRDIAKDAGVTTGAIYGHYRDKDELFKDIVSPVLDGLKEMLRSLQDDYHAVDNEKLKSDPMQLNPADAAVDYIYDHIDEFLLLINCAQDTSMKNWFEDFVAEETAASQRIQEKWEAAGILSRDLDVDFISIISASYFKCLFDAVGRGMGREKMKSFVAALSIYYTGGWEAMARTLRN